MARQPRLHVPGGFYHVTLRGNHRQPIFFDAADRNTLDWLVADALSKCAATLHAYCWMTNHLHMLVRISDVPLGRLIFRIASRYARWLQAGMSTTGHLFERRYHAILVDADAYLLTLVRYIHLNPVRAGLAREPGDYPWSSHCDYLGRRARAWVQPDFALRMFSPEASTARRKYAAFMQQSGEPRWGSGMLCPNADNKLVLGSDAFVAQCVNRPPSPRAALTLDAIVKECCDAHCVTPEMLASPSKSRTLSAARAWLAARAVASGTSSVSAVARMLHRSETAVRSLMARHSRAASNVRNV